MSVECLKKSLETPTTMEVVAYPEDTRVSSKLKQLQVQLDHCETCHTADALQAVKLDPAVLDAQVTLQGQGQGPPAHPAAALRDQLALVSTPSLPTEETRLSESASFERMVTMHKAALLSLTPDQYELLMKFAATLRRQRVANQLTLECAFCRNNGEPASWYSSHALRNWRGRIQCPVLRACRCPRCGATGDHAHTPKYCPGPGNTGVYGLAGASSP